MHNIYDQFLGSWWGAIIGQSLIKQSVSSLPQPFMQLWLKRRWQIGQMLLEPQKYHDSLAQLIGREATTNSWQHNSILLSLLPLIIFYSDRHSLSAPCASQGNLKLANLVKGSYLSSDVLLWSYLLTTVLNHKTDFLKHKLTKEVIFNHAQISKSSAAWKLKLVESEITKGITFESLKAKLFTQTGWQSTAIALSWYCFISTPHDPKLSIQRAARVEPNLTWLTTALTGTLSGAYNGMTRISAGWKIDREPSPRESQENHLFIKLFKSWLGIYDPDLDIELWNGELDAIGLTQSIQPRPSLKIISQLSRYS